MIKEFLSKLRPIKEVFKRWKQSMVVDGTDILSGHSGIGLGTPRLAWS